MREGIQGERKREKTTRRKVEKTNGLRDSRRLTDKKKKNRHFLSVLAHSVTASFFVSPLNETCLECVFEAPTTVTKQSHTFTNTRHGEESKKLQLHQEKTDRLK